MSHYANEYKEKFLDREVTPESYRKAIIRIALELNNGLHLFRAYHYILAKYNKEKSQKGGDVA